jgi:hypothetical protein
MKEKLERLLKDYGAVAIVVYFSLFFLTLGGFLLALSLGVRVQTAAGKAGILGAAYVATQLTKLVRIAATVALTPVVHSVWQRMRGKGPPATPVP